MLLSVCELSLNGLSAYKILFSTVVVTQQRNIHRNTTKSLGEPEA